MFSLQRNYHLYNNIFMQFVLYFFVFVNLMLALFEEPAVNGLSMPYWVSALKYPRPMPVLNYKLRYFKIEDSSIAL